MAPAPAPVPAGNGHAAERRPAAERQPAADDERSGVLAERELLQQLTELLLTAAPRPTGGVIAELRGQLLEFARMNGWVG
jgi:cold shock protein